MAAGVGELLQQQTLEQGNAKITDQVLVHREYGAGGEWQYLDREIIGTDDGDLAFGEP